MRRPSAERGPLFHPEELRLRMVSYYYDALNADSEFLAALSALENGAERDLNAFAQRWCLPTDYGAADLAASVRWARRRKTALVLRPAAPRPYYPGRVGEAVEHTVCDDGERVTVREWQPMIRLAPPQPFTYDPRHHSHAWLHAEAERISGEIRRSILEQGQVLEDQAAAQGWRRMPPQYHKAETLREMAQRLYLRAVKRKSLKEIARAELQRVSVSSISEQVSEWARLLAVPLPNSNGSPKLRLYPLTPTAE